MRAIALRGRIKPPHLGIASQVTVALLVVGLMGAMAIEPARQLLEQKRRLSEMSSELQTVENVNVGLQERIRRLNDPDFVEQRAREQIGLVREGETTYVIMPPSKPAGKAKHRKPAATKNVRPAHRGPAKKATKTPEPNFADQVLNFLGL